MSIEEKDQVALAIVETNEDAVLVSRPFCEKCATKKLKALFFCKISNKEAIELSKLYKLSTVDDAISMMFSGYEKKDKKDKKPSNIQKISSVRIICECSKSSK